MSTNWSAHLICRCRKFIAQQICSQWTCTNWYSVWNWRHRKINQNKCDYAKDNQKAVIRLTCCCSNWIRKTSGNNFLSPNRHTNTPGGFRTSTSVIFNECSGILRNEYTEKWTWYFVMLTKCCNIKICWALYIQHIMFIKCERKKKLHELNEAMVLWCLNSLTIFVAHKFWSYQKYLSTKEKHWIAKLRGKKRRREKNVFVLDNFLCLLWCLWCDSVARF